MSRKPGALNMGPPQLLDLFRDRAMTLKVSQMMADHMIILLANPGLPADETDQNFAILVNVHGLGVDKTFWGAALRGQDFILGEHFLNRAK